MTLYPSLVYGALDLTDVPYLLEFGTDVGSPENVYVALERMLQDGEVVSSARSSNRSISFTVLVEGSDMLALAEHEQALILEADKPRNTLVLNPGDGYGAATVFDTFRAQVTLIRDDEYEQMLTRRYVVELTALPFGRSIAPVLADAVFEGTATVVDGMDAATGWTATDRGGAALVISVDTAIFATSTGSLSVTAPYVNVYPDDKTSLVYHIGKAHYLRAASIAMSGSEYLTIQVRTQYAAGAALLEYTKSGVTTQRLEPVSAEATLGGFTRYKWRVGDGAVSNLKFTLEQYVYGPANEAPATMKLWADDLTRVAASGSTSKQSLRLLSVAGSVRSPGSLQISHATAALGQTLVFTCPDRSDGYRPDLRRWRTAGPAVGANSATVSGSEETIAPATPTVFSPPARMLAEGAYWLMVRAKRASGAGTLTAVVRTRLNGVTLHTTTTREATGLTTSYLNHLIDSPYLPGVAVPPGSAAVIEVELSQSGSASIQVDEAWLFRADGVLTEVDCGTAAPSAGGSSNRLWLDTASVDRPTPAVWVGTLADRTDARYAGPVLSGGLSQHEFVPPKMDVFVVTANVAGPTVTLQHHPRWHTNAAS